MDPITKKPCIDICEFNKKLDELTRKPMSSFKAWLPCVLVGVVLVISRTVPAVKDAFTSVSLGFTNILGETGINASFQPLYLPGGILVMIVIATFFLHRMQVKELTAAVRESGGVLLSAGFVLLFTVPMVRILINSGVNMSDLPSMPIAMAAWVADSVGGIYPLLAPAGNMVAIHNVVAASATVGLPGEEGQTLRRTIWPALYNILFAGLLALVATYMLGVTDPLLGVL